MQILTTSITATSSAAKPTFFSNFRGLQFQIMTERMIVPVIRESIPARVVEFHNPHELKASMTRLAYFIFRYLPASVSESCEYTMWRKMPFIAAIAIQRPNISCCPVLPI